MLEEVKYTVDTDAPNSDNVEYESSPMLSNSDRPAEKAGLPQRARRPVVRAAAERVRRPLILLRADAPDTSAPGQPVQARPCERIVLDTFHNLNKLWHLEPGSIKSIDRSRPTMETGSSVTPLTSRDCSRKLLTLRKYPGGTTVAYTLPTGSSPIGTRISGFLPPLEAFLKRNEMLT